MKNISDAEIQDRIRFENPWWNGQHLIDEDIRHMKERAYCEMLFPLVRQRDPRRAVVLMGPRRVGKTVMLKQVVQRLIADGENPRSLSYLDLQSPTFVGIPLDRLLRLSRDAAGLESESASVMIYDEIQYLKGWEVQLKNAVDTQKNVKFVASGSAAAALK